MLAGPAAMAASDALRIEEIVVTAERREASIQDVGVAVSALDQQAIQRLNARNISDLQGIVPNLTISEVSIGPSLSQISIRGVNSQDPEKSFDPAVGVFIDEVYLGTSAFNLMDTFDLERIEVLRGPQGTLFGRNTTGGAIVAQRTKPTGEASARASMILGTAERRDVKVVLHSPAVFDDLLAFKVAAYSEKDEGLWDNDTPGGPEGEEDRWSTSAVARFTPNDRIDVLLTYDRAEDDSDLPPYYPRGVTAPSPLPIEVTDDDLPVPATVTPAFPPDIACGVYGVDVCQVTDPDDDARAGGPHFLDAELDALTLNGTFELTDTLTMTSVVGWRDSEEAVYIDFDGTPLTIFDVVREQDYDQTSAELRLASSFGGPFEFVTGAFWFHSEYGLRQAIKLDLADVGAPVPPQLLYINANGDEDDHEATTTALFAQADYWITDRLRLTAGLRGTWDEKEIETRFYGSNLPPTADYQITDGIPAGRPLLDSGKATESWFELTPKVALNWERSDDLLLYASWTRGYNAGGFSARAGTVPSVTTAFDPETIDAYEIGLKSDLLGGRLRINAAAFYNDYQDKQEEAIAPAPPPTFTSTTVRNVASAEIMGLELEVSAILSEQFRLDANLGLLDAEYDDFDGFLAPSQYISNPPQPPNTLVEVDFSSLEMRRTPDVTFSLIPTFEQQVGAGTLTAYSIIRYTDEMYVEILNDARGLRDSQWFVDAAIAYAFGGETGDRFQAKLFGRNLTDEREFGSFTNSIVDFGTVQAPRNWALELTARF